MGTDTRDNKTIRQWLCNGEFDDAMLSDFMEFYYDLKNNNEKEAIIFINSQGGAVNIANSIISVIEDSGIKFHTVVIGIAYSAGLLLSAAGDVRWASERSDFMFHDMAIFDAGKLDEVQENLERNKELSKHLLTRFSKKTKKNYAWWVKQTKERVTRDFFFNQKNALSYGVIDKLGLPEPKMTNKKFEI